MKKTLLILSIVMAGCGNHSGNELALKSQEAAPVTASFDANSQVVQPVSMTDRKLIKNGDLTFETSSVSKSKEAIEGICKKLNAYISNESQNNFEDRLQYNQTIRVPASKFDTLIQWIEPLAIRLENKNINTQDVTEEFIDVQARLQTKKELEIRYREILKQAKTVADIVSIESQIATVRSEIESMEGRLTYLQNQVSFSTLHVSYYERSATPFGFGYKFVHSLSQGWDNLLTFLILMVNLWPFLIIIAGIAIGVTRWQHRKKRQ
jgi:hypothetical protein